MDKRNILLVLFFSYVILVCIVLWYIAYPLDFYAVGGDMRFNLIRRNISYLVAFSVAFLIITLVLYFSAVRRTELPGAPAETLV